MNANDRDELLKLLARESYFERELTLASGRASNFYIDCKRTLYLPRGAHLAGELKPGDRLPSERLLQTSSRMARGTIREGVTGSSFIISRSTPR